MQRLALLCVLVPAGAVLSGTPVTNPTIRNAVASLAWQQRPAVVAADADRHLSGDAAEKPIHDSMHSAAPPLLRDRPRLSLCNLNSTIQHMVRDHDAV